MAATTGATTTTSITEQIPAETLHPRVGDWARTPPVYMQTCGIMSLQGRSNVHRVIRWDSLDTPLAEASGKTQTDEFAATEQTSSESTLTAATVGIRLAMALEARLFAGTEDPYAAAVRNMVASLNKQIEEDAMSRITAATNTTDHSGMDATITRFMTGLAALRANKGPRTRIAMSGNIAQISDLRLDLGSQTGGIYASQWGAVKAEQMMDGMAMGFQWNFANVDFFESENIPQFDANNWSGALVGLDSEPANCGLLLGFWIEPTMVVPDGDNRAIRLQDDAVLFSIYASTLNRNDNVQEWVTGK